MNPPSTMLRAVGDQPRTDADALASEFHSESDPLKSGVSGNNRKKYFKLAGVLIAGLALSASAVVVLPGAGRPEAVLDIQSDPVGAEVRIDGELRGRTPLVLELAPGTHTVVVGGTDQSKERRVTLAAAERASIYHVISETPSAASFNRAAASAALSVVTDPPGGRVTVDGTDRGTAPLVVQNLTPGEHRLAIRNQGALYQRTVTLEPGATATVVIGANPVAAAGWLSVDSSLRLQIYEGGRLLGTTETDRLMLPVGDHVLTFSDERTGFETIRSVRVAPGDTVRVSVPVPSAPVNVNAIPWADVWMNNQRVGETPIGNYMLPLGNHEVELRHPELGIKRVTLFVSLNGPNRLAVNMRAR